MEEEIARMIVTLMGDYDQYKDALEDASNLTQAEASRMRFEMKQTEKQIKELNQVAKEGEAVTKSVQNASEKYSQEIAKLDNLLEQGAISQNTYNRAINRATNDFMQANNVLRNVGQSMTTVGNNLSLYVTAPLTALGALAVGEFNTMETTALRLKAAIEANGRPADALLKNYQNFASELQKVTRVGDDTTLGLIQEAESLGVSGEAAKRAAKNAIALSVAKGMSESAAIRMTVALEQGREEMLQRYIPSLRGIQNESDRVAKAHEVLGNMFKVAEADAKSVGGSIAQLKNDFGDLMEEVGGVIADGMRPLIAQLKEGVAWFQQLSPETKKSVVEFAALAAVIGPTISLLGKMSMMVGGLVQGVLSLTSAQLAFGTSVGVWAALAAGMTYAWDAIGGFGQKADDLEGAQKRVADATQKTIELMNEQAQAGLRGADASFLKSEALEQEVKRLEEMQKRLDASAAAAAQRRTGAEGRVGGGIAGFFGLDFDAKNAAGFAAEQEKQANQVAEANRRNLDAAKAALEAQGEGLGAGGAGPSDKDYEALRQFTAQMNVQIETFGKTGEAAKLAALELKGFSEEELALARDQIKTIEAQREGERLKKEQKDAAEKDAKRAADEQKKLMDRGKSLTEKYMTPQEKMAKDQAELQNLLENGAIDAETYNRALDDLHKTTQKDYKVQMGVTGFDAVLSGSADAFRRIREQRDLLSKGGEVVMGMKPGSGQMTVTNRSNTGMQDKGESQDRVETLLTEIRDAITGIARDFSIENAGLA